MTNRKPFHSCKLKSGPRNLMDRAGLGQKCMVTYYRSVGVNVGDVIAYLMIHVTWNWIITRPGLQVVGITSAIAFSFVGRVTNSKAISTRS